MMLAQTNQRNFRAAVILAGSGVYDGSEITETSSILIALSKHKADVQCFAPNREQMHVVNHLNGEEQKDHTRNVMAESARIARGNVLPLSKLSSEDYDALFMPGGFGAAKNWSDFGVKGAQMTVQDDVAGVLKDFHAAKKQIGLCCIAPVVAAKVFGTKSGGPGLKMTLGCRGDDWPHNGAIDAATSFGNEVIEAQVDQVCHDEVNRIHTVPAYMKGSATPSQVFSSVAKLVDSVAQNVRKTEASVSQPISLLVQFVVKEDRLAEAHKVMKQDA
jgi:enhancing lycopene biosynthesis protein 2